MSFSAELKAALKSRHLLNHPFYAAWNEGALSRETIRDYAEQYAHHVDRFSRHMGLTYAQCDDVGARRLLLENMSEEEGVYGEQVLDDHPTLWRNFAKGMGATDDSINNAALADCTRNLIETLQENAKSSYAEGLCSLYTYEHQVPEIAETKIKGLKEFYGGDQAATLKFFEVHQAADIVHREVCEKLIDALPATTHKEAKAAAMSTADALWDFLSGMMKRAQARGEMPGVACAA
jgi:pyrroloquinoline-quinone synthase